MLDVIHSSKREVEMEKGERNREIFRTKIKSKERKREREREFIKKLKRDNVKIEGKRTVGDHISLSLQSACSLFPVLFVSCPSSPRPTPVPVVQMNKPAHLMRPSQDTMCSSSTLQGSFLATIKNQPLINNA